MKALSRRAAFGLIGTTALLGAGCMSKPLRPPQPDGRYCFSFGKYYQRKLTCTTAPIPSAAVEADAKRFEPAAGLLTVYVVRKRWGDAINQVRLAADGGAQVVTTPESFVRLRLKPGVHKLSIAWPDGATSLDVSGEAGEVQFVEVVGSVWTWGSTYRLERGDPADSRKRIANLRLVADAL